VRRVLFAMLVLAPGAAAAQVPIFSGDAPRSLDPGAPEPPPAPAAQPAPAAKPNVLVVGPDGKVTYGDQGDAPSGYYMSSGDPGHYEEPVQARPGPTPDLHVVRRGDTLWDICFYYFNDPWQWPKVWSYNPQITNPHWIYPGDLVRLLPRGMFVEQPGATTTEPDAPDGAIARTTAPVDNLPAPAQRSSVGLRQLAFVEKSDLDRSIKIDGSVDEKELLTIGDSVYLSYPANNPPQVGKRYSIYAADNQVKYGGKDVGAYVRLLGTVEVVSVIKDKRARGVIVEANQEIERGARVGPLLKKFANPPPVPPKTDAQGAIVAMLTKDQLIGQGEVIFVNLGKQSGVQVGNRMFVVRRGDALPPMSSNTVGQDDRRFPARALGEVVIVEIGDKISIALVTLAVQEMSVGDLVMMQAAD
jgi:hypothetical protein